jgi:hypothetical protein
MDAGSGRDRRRATRYQVGLPVELQSGAGTTRDVSESGVFFETDQPLTVGSPISFSLILGHADPEGPFRLQCKGSIVRVEEAEGKVGVAARITSYRATRW